MAPLLSFLTSFLVMCISHFPGKGMLFTVILFMQENFITFAG